MALLTQAAAALQEAAPAIIDENGSCSWERFNQRVNRLIRALRGAGVRPGDHIALYAGNSRAVFELMAAAHHAGVMYVPVNWHFTAEELAHVLADSQAVGLFTDARFGANAQQALILAPHAARRMRWWAAMGTAVPAPEGWTELETVIAAQPDASEPPDQAPGGPMFYTSGTTGQPKGVLRVTTGPPPPVEALKATVDGAMAMLQLSAQGCTLLAGPYYHSAQWSFSFFPLLAGARLVMTQRFDAGKTLALIDEHRVTQLHLVPTQFIRLLRLPDESRQAFDGSSLQRVWHGAAPCPPQAKREMIDWWGPCICEYYGSTEGAVVTGIASAEWLERPGSVGCSISATEVLILREDGTTAPAGEQGTIYLRNRRGVGLAYHNDAAKTQAAHRAPGLFTTGDVGWMDPQGYLYLTDRKIDMIICGGVNIYPAEIESTLASHPAVQDVAVIGVPHAEFGEEVKAIVQLVPGVEAGESTTATLLQHCRQTLAGYKLPRSVDYCEAFPRTETGKLQKRLLREPYWAGSGRRI